jgi:uncharacterized membrane protein
MDDLSIARALHVAALVHWIGGVSMVTLVLLPRLPTLEPVADRLRRFELIEGRFAKQARISTFVAGASGAWMVYRLDAWDRFADLRFWWLHAMVLVWAVFTLMLFVLEPLFLHKRFREHAMRDPDRTFRVMYRFHIALLIVVTVTIVAGVLGAHGALY